MQFKYAINLNVSLIDEYGLDEFSSLAYHFAEYNGLLEQEHLQLFKFFGRLLLLAQLCTAVKLTMKQ